MTRLWGQCPPVRRAVRVATQAGVLFDGIAVGHNQALIIECKAKKQDQAQDAIYKLGQLVKQVGGLMARGLYLSARQVSDTDRNRAREYGVDVLAAEELANLSDYLRRWKDNDSARP